ncbi:MULTISPECIES: NUDIX hydrolase [Corynebacterium]|nr:MULTISPECIES: CoA pyrophosphatase [Corynebacterium]MCI1255469.1 CoA pyrophosphatase [Corynebacterium provencense]
MTSTPQSRTPDDRTPDDRTPDERVRGGGVPLGDWLAGGRRQPDLPGPLPDWLRPLVGRARRTSTDRATPGLPVGGSSTVPELGPDGTPPRPSAVLVLLGREQGQDPTVMLTHRTPTLRSHSGQLAFPGGHRESVDADPVATALREATEETGLDPSGVTPLAVLDPLYIDRTNHAVVPVIGWWRRPVPVAPATAESDWVRSVPLSELSDPAKRMYLGIPGTRGWRTPAFDVDGYLLWGFTGALVDGLLKMGEWEQPWTATAPVLDLFDALAQSRNGETLTPEDLL